MLRVGFFPNLTHAQALAARALLRRGDDELRSALPPSTRIEWFPFNAGPSAMEALLAGTLDLAYVGPNPAINAFARTDGEAVRIVAGAAMGGAALVVPRGSPLRAPADFRGKRVGTPHFGNTQDVACRAWLAAGGMKITQTGGDAHVLPTPNPEQATLMNRGDLDAVWTVEPWVSMIEAGAGAVPIVEERDAVTVVLVASTRALRERPALVKSFVAAHARITDRLNADPAAMRVVVKEELTHVARASIPDEILSRAWSRLRFDARPPREGLRKFAEAARAAGFLGETPPLDRLTEAP